MPQSKVMHLAKGASMEAGAALLFTYGATNFALAERARMQPGQTLLVLGASGGTGASAVEIGNLMGARVIAAASSSSKLAFARSHGVYAEMDYSKEDLQERLRSLTAGRGVDVVTPPSAAPSPGPHCAPWPGAAATW